MARVVAQRQVLVLSVEQGPIVESIGRCEFVYSGTGVRLVPGLLSKLEQYVEASPHFLGALACPDA